MRESFNDRNDGLDAGSTYSGMSMPNSVAVGSSAHRQDPAALANGGPAQGQSNQSSQLDDNQRQGVNEYLQKKYSQKFNFH